MCQSVNAPCRPTRNRYPKTNGQFLYFYSITILDTPVIYKTSVQMNPHVDGVFTV